LDKEEAAARRRPYTIEEAHLIVDLREIQKKSWG